MNLFEKYNCRIQIGGSDQWGNLTSGMELIRKVKGDNVNVFGITSPLITKSDGSKFGKSEGKNIWLDPAKTNAYEFYQFWINTPDADIVDYLKRLSLRTPEEIMELEKSTIEHPELRAGQKALAEELTRLVHGEKGLAKAIKITETLFKGSISELTVEELREGLSGAEKCDVEDGITLIDALVKAGVSKSKGDARKLIQQGSIQVNGVKADSIETTLLKRDAYDNEFSIIKKGKKNYIVVTF